MNPKISQDHLQRRAIVYVRQSTATQLQQNRESQIRQYGLAIRARDLVPMNAGSDRIGQNILNQRAGASAR